MRWRRMHAEHSKTGCTTCFSSQTPWAKRATRSSINCFVGYAATFINNWARVLINGLAPESGDHRERGRHQLFGGCYFAATGDSADQRSFVKSVFEKMQQMEDELEWTDEAVRKDRRCAGLANTLLAFNGLLLLAVVGMLVYSFVR